MRTEGTLTSTEAGGQAGSDELLSPLAILKQSSRISGASLVRVLISFPVSLITARVLGPELLGVFGLVGVWQLYTSLAIPQLFSAAYRRMPALISRGDVDEAVRIQNVGITQHLVFPLVGAAVMVGAALYQHDPTIRTALIVGAGASLLSQFWSIFNSVQRAYQRFGLIATGNLVSGIATSLFTVAAVWWLGVYALLLAPAVTAVIALSIYRLGAPPVSFRLAWDGSEFWGLLKVGISLALMALFYWGFRTVDRTAVALWLPLADLGYFTFIMQFVTVAISFVSDFGGVLEPKLWIAIHRPEGLRAMAGQAQRLMVSVLLVTCASANLAQAGFGAFVHWFVPNFVPAITTFEIIAFLLAVTTATIVPNVLLNSTVLNKQNVLVAIYGVGVALNAGLAWGAVQLGLGLNGIAVSSVVAQGLLSAILLATIDRYVVAAPGERLRLYGSLAGLLALCLGVFVLFHFGLLTYAVDHNVAATMVLRIAVAMAAWGGLGLALLASRRGLRLKGLRGRVL